MFFISPPSSYVTPCTGRRVCRRDRSRSGPAVKCTALGPWHLQLAIPPLTRQNGPRPPERVEWVRGNVCRAGQDVSFSAHLGPLVGLAKGRSRPDLADLLGHGGPSLLTDNRPPSSWATGPLPCLRTTD